MLLRWLAGCGLYTTANPSLTTDQAWRQPTNPRLRFLERLKDNVAEIEQGIHAVHESANEAHRSIPEVVGYSEYQASKADLEMAEFQKKELLSQLTILYQRSDKIFAGDVGSEIITIKQEIKKLEREKQEEQRKLAAWQQPCAIQHKNNTEVAECENNRAIQQENLHQAIHRIDSRIIELQTDQEELQHYDFQRLWKDTGLHLPATESIARVPQESLTELREKIQTLNSIPALDTRQPRPEQAPQSSRKELCQKMRAEIEDTRKRYRKEKEERLKNAGTQPEAKRWENFYNDAEQELDEELKKWLR